MPMRQNRQSQKIALCGVLCALSLALLLVGNALQLGTYAAPMLASFLLLPVQEEYGPRYALLLYAATAILATLLVPDKELALFYALVLGYYPVLKQRLDRLHPAPLRWAAKLLCFNGATLALYALLLTLLAGPALRQEMAGYGPAMLALLLGLGDLAFLLCDVALARLAVLYRLRVRPHLRRYL